MDRERRHAVLGAALAAAMLALAIGFGALRARRATPTTPQTGDVTELAGAGGRYTFAPTRGRLEVTSADGQSRLELDLSLVVDGAERPLLTTPSDVKARDVRTLVASFPLEMGEERAAATLELTMDPAGDALSAAVSVVADGAGGHTFALKAGLAPEGRAVFLPGAGALGDRPSIDARAAVVDDDVHPFALYSPQGGITVTETPPDVERPGARPRLSVTTRRDTESHTDPADAAATPSDASAAGASSGRATSTRLELSVAVGATSQSVWGRLYGMLRVGTARVSGAVTGARERAHVYALDEDGRPELRAVVGPDGRFVVDAPASALRWYAALEASQTSAPVRFAPGTPWELKLDVSPGGELHVRMRDGDTGRPLVARLIVKGIEGTLDPSFGPDYRASGAGPLMDVLEGEVTTPLPAGRYRVSITKGIEWSIDAEDLEIASGRTRTVELAIRHVVPTPGMVGCDLHVHARPSFDSPVTPEDRVLSLVSAGVDFAVPTEHNLVGDYAPALELTGLGEQLAHVSGVEVTTFNPRFGHFGVFPWPLGANVPRFRGTTAGGILASARRGDPSRIVQVNHPRLAGGIGYFGVVSFDPRSGRVPLGMRTDFDTIEVYNGYDLADRARVEQVMEDWYALLNLGRRMAATGSSDSHRIQYQWAGYPRTYALVEPRAAGEDGGVLDTAAVIAALKRGRSFVTSGPVVELALDDGGRAARPGDELAGLQGRALTGRLRVRAAPWVDVSGIDVVAGVPGSPPPIVPASAPSSAGPRGAAGEAAARGGPGTAQLGGGAVQVVFHANVPSRPSRFGKESGTLDEASAGTLRYDETLALDLPEGTRWVLAVVRGERRLDDALPFMPVKPLAFTNPIWIAR